MKEEKNSKKWISWFIFAVGIIIVYNLIDNFTEVKLFVGNFMTVLTPFLIGILIAYLLYFPCKSIEKMYGKIKVKFINKKRRSFAVLTTYLIVLLIVIIIVNVLIPTLSKSILDLASNLPTYYKNVTEFVENQPEDSILNQVGAKEIIENLEQIDIKQWFSIDNIINYIKSALGIVNGLFSAFVTIVVSIYLLAERSEILEFIKKLSEAIFNKKVCESLGKYFGKANEIFYRFISSQILDGIVVGTILSIAMLIMDIEYAVLLGFMIGIFNIIPYFGAIVGVTIAIIITILTGGFSQAIWMAIITIILQQIDSNIINPKIVGNSLTLSPILVIFAVTVGGAYFGILGMFLAVPLITVIKILVEDYIDYRRNKRIEG